MAEVHDSEQLTQFRALAPGCDESQARFLLEAAGGDVAVAMNMYLEHAEHSHHAAPAARPQGPQQRNVGQQNVNLAATPPRPRAPVARPAEQPQRGAPGLVRAVLRLPFSAIRFGFGMVSWAVWTSLTMAAVVGDTVLPASVMRTARTVVATVAGTAEEPDPPAQAQHFIQAFKRAYGDRHPRFLEVGCRQAVQQAKTSYKFLFVYLHSSEHEDTDKFCSEVMTAPEIVEFVNHNFLSWGGDVRFSDAYLLCQRLQVTRYPFMALLNTTPDNRVQLVTALSGMTSSDALLVALMTAVETQGLLLAAQRAEQEERELAQALRAQQDEEYEASLAADRQREAQRQEERRRKEEEERAIQEEEARQRALHEAEEKRMADRAAEISARRERKRASLAPEASPGPGTAQVRIRLPDGSFAQRCFGAGSALQAVYDYVDSLDSTNYLAYHLVSNFPRRTFKASEAHMSLEALGLVPQAALFVQPEDEA